MLASISAPRMSWHRTARLGALALAAAFAGSPALAQVEATSDIPTVTIINKAPAAATATPQLEVTPAPVARPLSEAGPSPAPAQERVVRITRPDTSPTTAPEATQEQDAAKAGEPAPAAAAQEPASTPPPPPPPPTLAIDIDLTRQIMTVAEHGVELHTWQISSARYGYRTPTGTFQPTWMTKMWYSRQYDLAPMPHAIFFHKGVAIHGTYATRALGNPASHGCVRLALANAATLFKLVARHGKDRTQIVVHGTPDHTTAGRVASYRDRGTEDVIRYRRTSSFRYLPPSAYGRGYGAYGYGTTRRAYAAPRRAPRGSYNSYSYGYGF
jgi:lipoprotein-anchoring transpeptidase ErfK/SrfK